MQPQRGKTMSRLAELLNDLGQKADVQKAYTENPETVMNEYGLSKDEIGAMLAKDVEKLKQLSGLENLKANGSVSAHD
jgi:hypothetical protein